jgi:hypothetical protein
VSGARSWRPFAEPSGAARQAGDDRDRSREPARPTVRVGPGGGLDRVASLTAAGVLIVTVAGLGGGGPSSRLGAGAGSVPAAPSSVPARMTVPTGPWAVPPSRAWLARRSDGSWLLGRGGRTTHLAPNEIGLAVGNSWLLTSNPASYGHSIAWRGLDEQRVRSAGIDVVPASTAIAGSTGYVTGFDRATAGDPGLFTLSLTDGSVSQVIAPTRGTHPRSVVATPDQSRVVSATCDDVRGCDLSTLATDAVTASTTVHAPGYLRATTDSVAIVGADPADWIAGIDLATGHELWRRDAQEIWNGYTTSDGHLVQAELRHTTTGPTFAVSVIDAETGAAETVFSAPVGHGIGLWPELSSDEVFAVGPAYSLEDGLARAGDGTVTVRLIRVADGHQVGTDTIDGSN